jgi:Kef-type K+ transport system membrane component KefB
MTPLQEFFSSELGYVVLLFALFVFPKVLQRWRIPAAITSFVLGAVAAIGFGLFQHDQTVHLMSTFGIVALFLFAGLEVDVTELRRQGPVLVQHLAVRGTLLLATATVLVVWFGADRRLAAIVALALLTPSTGFILDSLDRFGLTEQERFWVKSKAIATELLALTVLFFTQQSTGTLRLVLATLAMAAIVAALPAIFRMFAQRIAPFAPKSEFAVLLMMAVLAAYATRRLGAYYLVGAFIAGVAARRFRDLLPAMASERMLHAVEVFASFFVPFYFFAAGASVDAAELSLRAAGVGLIFLAIFVPVALVSVSVHRRLALKEPLRRGARVAAPMLPTLVFTLVLAGILREDYHASPVLYGGLIVYTLLNTMIPGFVLGAPTPAFDAVELPSPAVAPDSGAVAESLAAPLPTPPPPEPS